MDLVPHIPHLNGLDLELLKMHVDPEPRAGAQAHQVNGHGPGSFSETNGFGVNGHGYPRAGTYL